MILGKLTADEQGVAPAQIESVSLTTTVTAQRKRARIIGVSVPGGLKRGKNTVQTILAAYGTQPLQVATTELVIPAGMSTNGVLSVAAPRNNEEEDYFYFSGALHKRFTDNRPTVADIITKIDALPQNNDLLVTYRPRPSRPEFPERSAGASKGTVKVTSHSDWVTQGSISLPTGRILLHVMPRTVRHNGRVRLVGIVPSAHGQSSVKIYQRTAGTSSFQLVASLPLVVRHGLGSFQYHSGKLTRNTTFKAAWDGDDRSLGATATMSVRVRPH